MYCLLGGLISGGIHNFMASSVCFCHGLYIYIYVLFFCEGRLQLQIRTVKKF